MEYQVKWVIDIEADTPREAAERALEIMRDPTSTAQYFEVTDPDNGFNIVDLFERPSDSELIAAIVDVLDGKEWGPDTLDTIADALRRGYKIRGTGEDKRSWASCEECNHYHYETSQSRYDPCAVVNCPCTRGRDDF